MVDLRKILSKYKKGWLALSPDNKSLIASGNTLKEVLEKARTKGIKNPTLLKVPPLDRPFIGKAQDEF
jgi:hypothetical protein